MSTIDEIAPDIFRITTYVSAADLQFSQFLIRDDEPLLYHTGHNRLFPEVLAAVRSLIKPEALRWIGFSHNESDENGSLNQWLEQAPHATALAGVVAAATGVNDVAIRPPRVLQDDERLCTGRHTLRFLITPYVPHSWESSLLFDETEQVLFCSDLFVQHGNPPLVRDDILTPAIADLQRNQSTPFRDSIPFTSRTRPTLARLAALKPKTLATMHGSVFHGDCAPVLNALGEKLEEVLVTA
ncbi:MAG TPA: MBL fold metallo-hydrolase [Castellaniella sp.]|uniref:MBL fold metallo-hydrolase n=1 Tax=Castellaniella sp. TaxID=1955812 RepID=UPI002F11AF6D